MHAWENMHDCGSGMAPWVETYIASTKAEVAKTRTECKRPAPRRLSCWVTWRFDLRSHRNAMPLTVLEGYPKHAIRTKGTTSPTVLSPDSTVASRLQDLRQAMSELEGKLKEEQRRHAATRAEASATDAALTRKAAALQSAEAEQQQLKNQIQDTETLLRELTQAKLEESGNDAADRRAQHMHAVRAALSPGGHCD